MQITDSTWYPHQPKTWPVRYGELMVDTTFEWFTGNHSNTGPIMRKELVKAGTTVKIVMVSRFGDVGITNKLDSDTGYGLRGIPIDKLENYLDNLRLSR